MIRLSILFILLIYPIHSIANWFGPSNYDECVLASMKGVTSDMAARAVVQSCRSKFSEKKKPDTQIPDSVVTQLDGRAGMTSYGYFKGRIYNGSKEWTITQITVVLTEKPKDKPSTGTPRMREYNVDVDILPLTDSEFLFAADSNSTSEFNWSLARARGYKTR